MLIVCIKIDCCDFMLAECLDNGHFLCEMDNLCIRNNMRCNGANDCISGEDEIDCGTLYRFSQHLGSRNLKGLAAYVENYL